MSPPHFQELRGQYVRRLPSQSDVKNRRAIVLTERDQQLGVAVHQHGFVTTEVAELAFFTPAKPSRTWPSSRAYERMRELWLWGYLERVELPVARVLGGRRPFLYALGRQALPFLELTSGFRRDVCLFLLVP